MHPLDLRIPSGELLVVLGPSGSGKSTLLRLIAGLDAATSGGITFDGRDMANVSPRDRDLAMVFQNPVLYPHLSVFENLAFPARARRWKQERIAGRVHEIARALEIEPLLDREPAALSGGERQRVSLGRAVVREPRIILLDEPFSSLDPPLRVALRERLLDLRRGLGATMVLVTHDQEEALSMANQIAVLDRGRLLQLGKPREIYNRPADRFTASFVGSPAMNLIPCQIAAEGEGFAVRLSSSDPHACWPILREWLPRCDPPTGAFELGLRPESIRLRDPREGGPRFHGVVNRVEYKGADLVAHLVHDKQVITARLDAGTSIRPGEAVEMTFDLDQVVWFDNDGRSC